MQYTTLGKTGLVVSRLSFGAMTFGEGQLVPGVTNSIDQAIADQMVGHVMDAGINLFDTADAYTNGQPDCPIIALSGLDASIGLGCPSESGI